MADGPWEDYGGTAAPEAGPWDLFKPSEDEEAIPLKARPIAYSKIPPEVQAQIDAEPDENKAAAMLAAATPKSERTGGWRDSIPRMVQIESGGNPNARTGKYTGVLQMGPDERRKYGDDSYESGVRLLEDRAAELTRKLGREPTGAEVYFAHQQGLGGAMAHLNNPGELAWKNMYSTGEGQQKGQAWAKQAIWGNVPDDMKAQYGNVNNITSEQFADLWRRKVERGGGTRMASADNRPPWEMYGAPAEAQPKGGTAPAPGDAAIAPDENRPPWEDYEAPVVGAQGTATAGQALARGYYKTKGMYGGAYEVLGEALGSPEDIARGKSIREQAQEDIKSYPAQAEFLKIRGVGDAAQYAKETIIDFIPQIGLSLAGGVAGGMVGGPVGAAIGAAAPSLVMNTGDIQQQLKEKDANAVAPGWVAAGGTAAAALDVITPFRLGSKLLMRFGKETGEEVAKAAMERAAAKGVLRDVASEAGKSAAIEGTTEALQEVIGEMATSGALDQTPDWGSLPGRMTESFAAGALGGGVFGGGAQALVGRRGEVAPALPPEETPPGAPPPGPVTPPPGEPPPPGGYPGVKQPIGGWIQEVPADVVEFRPSRAPSPGYTGAAHSATTLLQPGAIDPRTEFGNVQLAAEALPSSGSANVMLSALQNSGVSAAALDALDIPRWLALQEGTVSKSDLLSHVETNMLSVETTPLAELGANTREHQLAMPETGPGTVPVPVGRVVTSDRITTDGREVLHINEAQSAITTGSQLNTAPADLALNRMVQMAAAEGRSRLTLPQGNTPEVRALVGAAKRLARKMPGSSFGHSYLDAGGEVLSSAGRKRELLAPHIDIPPEARDWALSQDREARGSMAAPPDATGTQETKFVKGVWRLGTTEDARAPVTEAANLLWRLARKLGISKKIQIIVRPVILELNGRVSNAMAQVYGLNAQGEGTGGSFIRNKEAASYVIEVALQKHGTIQEVWSSLSHELGHIIQAEFYLHGTSPLLKLQIDAAFKKHQAARVAAGVETFGQLYNIRDNFITKWYDLRTPPGQRAAPGMGILDNALLRDATAKERAYWTGFDEWFAEQVARHFTTSPAVLNAVDRFFAKLANALRTVYDAFRAKFPILVVTPDNWIAGWLDSRLVEPPFVAAGNEANKDNLAAANERAMHGIGVKDYPRTEADVTSIAGRKVMASVGETPEGRAMATAADRFNGFYKYMLSVVQVAARNLHIQPLQRYVELWQQKQLERAKMMSIAVETLRAWRNLGRNQADAVSAMLDAYMNMSYLTDQEFLDKVVRRPTEEEKAAMQKEHGLNDEARKVFDRITGDFDGMLLRYEALLRAEAMKLGDPALVMKRMLEISAQIERMKQIPYAPAMRFGDLVLLVKDADGNVVSRYHFETEGARKKLKKSLEKKLLAGERIELTAIPEQAKPFMGLPPGLLDLISEKLQLSDEQRKTINELKFEYAPAHGFQHRFQRKSRVPGYSTDFMRAYANYFFHGSNYFTNVKYVTPLREEIGLVKLSAEGLGDGTKRMQIHNFMNEHLNYMLDPRPDFAHLRGLMFHWGLGFSPAAAFVNLSQMALGSYPFLAGKFGDVSTVAAMLKAGTNLSSYYKRATLAGMTAERDMRALSEGVKQGVITEAMAPELAGITEQDNLRKGSFGKAAEMARLFAEASAFMFQTTEQINRRVTFRAAWQLALDNPTSKYVKEMKSKHSLQFESLVQQGWAENEAAAFVTAKDATESTQFIYHQWANPAFMRGKMRTVFIFKNFMQNTLFMLWHYPEARVRSLLVFAFLGGMMGLPGADDMKNLIKALGWRLFGKDWDVEQEARKLVIDMTEGKISPDLLLHGLSRYGFGAPAALGLMGIPFPTVDMSKSIGLGRISPVDPNTLLGQGASKDPKNAMTDAMTQILGYSMQVNANFYNALTDTQLAWNDAQRWTKAMPRALAGLSRSYQALSGPDPAIRNRTGSAVIRFDTSDSVQLMEALSMAAGFQPQRLTMKWDVIMAQREAQDFWHLKREGLLRQAWQARSSDDKENYSRAIAAIRDFNKDLPKEARAEAITSENIIQSFTTRARAKAMTELGLPTQKKDIALVRAIQQMYPGAEIDVHRTK